MESPPSGQLAFNRIGIVPGKHLVQIVNIVDTRRIGIRIFPECIRQFDREFFMDMGQKFPTDTVFTPLYRKKHAIDTVQRCAGHYTRNDPAGAGVGDF
jgi:hypothetical protein